MKYLVRTCSNPDIILQADRILPIYSLSGVQQSWIFEALRSHNPTPRVDSVGCLDEPSKTPKVAWLPYAPRDERP